KRRPLLERGIGLLDDRQIRESEKDIGVGPMHGMNEPALHEVPQLVFSKRAIPNGQISQRVVLLLEHAGGGHTDERAKLFFAHDSNLLLLLGVQLLGAFELVALLRRRIARWGSSRAGSLGTNHEHRRLRVDLFRGGSTETGDERPRILPPERAQLSGE